MYINYSFKGGGYNNEVSGTLCPLFLGYFEDSHFRSPHYQSVVPVRDSSYPVLDHGSVDLLIPGSRAMV